MLEFIRNMDIDFWFVLTTVFFMKLIRSKRWEILGYKGTVEPE